MAENNISLALPNETQFVKDISAINRFQQIVHQHMVQGHDYGIIPGTKKPTLLKPGAEKIAKLLGLADQYNILDRQEDWNRPFFRYLIKCSLTSVNTNVVISEGLGECNSMESKYRYRWLGERDLPNGIDKTKLVSQERKVKNGGHWFVYRIDNDDIFSQVNTILKMAKKRALVDAALSAGRLSEVFTQDIEDLANIPDEVIEGESRVVENKPEPTPETAESKSEPVKDTNKEKIQDEAKEPTTIKELLEWCLSHGKSYGPSWLNKEAGVSRTDQIKDIHQVYLNIKQVTGW